MKIRIFQRPDGSLWADYADLGARPGHKRVTEYDLVTRTDMEERIKNPGDFLPERVRALAGRALAEFLARDQQPVTRQLHAVAVAQIEGWGFGRRLKWLVTGK